MTSHKNTLELLPCPFCGDQPRYKSRKITDARHAVGCSNIDCILWMPADVKLRQLPNYAATYVFYDDMVKAWNTRASDFEFSRGFKRGQESVKRTNKSGCCCIINDDDLVVSACGAHKEWAENLNTEKEPCHICKQTQGHADYCSAGY